MKIRVIKSNRQGEWHIKPNYCRCMTANCDCDNWCIYNSNNEFVCSIVSKSLGIKYCREKNEEEAIKFQ